MINLVMEGDQTEHICELQIVHTSTNTVRLNMKGHESYAWVRSTKRLLQLAEEYNRLGVGLHPELRMKEDQEEDEREMKK